jgi:hypothetical protein
MAALRLDEGVIYSAFTIISVRAVLLAGATPVLADIDPHPVASTRGGGAGGPRRASRIPHSEPL